MMTTSLLTMGVIGFFFAIVLSLATKTLAVESDPKVDAIEEVLPGANCGACGYAGCRAFAEAVASGQAPIDGCPVGGQAVARAVAEIMGVAAPEGITRKIAQLLCNGGCTEATNRSEYYGAQDCRAALLAGGGSKGCTYGCLGLGTCEVHCPFDAITMNDNNLPVVDEELCTGCGKCVEACPRDLFQLVEEPQGVHIRCRSFAKGKDVRQVCTVGCIGCRRCVKECPYDAIHMEGMLAVIDYDKCTNCGQCVEVCPTNTIHKQPNKEFIEKAVAVS
ncbi:MAG: RnfABCDGE type electron transport complex subunit B [Limnochordia bacterium]|jgi:electron transport complex protein RnfB